MEEFPHRPLVSKGDDLGLKVVMVCTRCAPDSGIRWLKDENHRQRFFTQEMKIKALLVVLLALGTSFAAASAAQVYCVQHLSLIHISEPTRPY